MIKVIFLFLKNNIYIYIYIYYFYKIKKINLPVLTHLTPPINFRDGSKLGLKSRPLFNVIIFKIRLFIIFFFIWVSLNFFKG